VRDTDDVHCVVLQANGERAFCTGIDVKAEGDPWFVKDNVWNSFDPGLTLAPKTHHRVWKPVVTAVHGLCAGGGQYFLNESDIIICADDALFFDPHANVGIVSALEPIGMLQRGVPLGDVLRWALMGNEERITAETALRMGLVTEVVPDEQLLPTARQWADKLAAGPPIAVRITKRMMYKQQTMSLENALEDAAMAVMITNYRQDVKEGTAAFHEKRKPRFQGR